MDREGRTGDGVAALGADERVAAEIARTRADAEQEWNAKLEAELHGARSEAERQTTESIARAREEHEAQLVLERQRHSSAAKDMETDRQRLHGRDGDACRSALARSPTTRDEAHARLERVSRAHADLETERGRAQSELESERRHTAGEIENLRSRIDTLQDERRRVEARASKRSVGGSHPSASRNSARPPTRLQAARDQATTEHAAELAEARRQADEAHRARGREATEAAARTQARARPSLSHPAAPAFDQLSTGMQSIDSAHTLSEALDSLLRHAAGIASRGALFLVNGDRLRSWKTVGFPQLDAQPFDAAMSGAGILAKAVQSGEAVASGAGQPAPTFAAVPLDCGARGGAASGGRPRGCGSLRRYRQSDGTRSRRVLARRPSKRWRITRRPCLRS